MNPAALAKPHTVTFDCWATLLTDASGRNGAHERGRVLSRVTGVPEARAVEALNAAWREHQIAWHRGEVFAARHMTRHALDALSASVSEDAFEALVHELEDQALGHRVSAVNGAKEMLRRLAAAGVRRALICDTGFSPARVVRQFLDRTGLLDFLEVTIFSDEVGAPKPNERPFAAALAGLGVSPTGSVHIGDLRRSDVAGARAYGMGTIRFAAINDDTDASRGTGAGIIDCAAAACTPVCARPEADAVVTSYKRALVLFGY